MAVGTVREKQPPCVSVVSNTVAVVLGMSNVKRGLPNTSNYMLAAQHTCWQPSDILSNITSKSFWVENDRG